MLYREIIYVCSEIHTKHINTLCGQNVELLSVKLLVHIATIGFLRRTSTAPTHIRKQFTSRSPTDKNTEHTQVSLVFFRSNVSRFISWITSTSWKLFQGTVVLQMTYTCGNILLKNTNSTNANQRED